MRQIINDPSFATNIATGLTSLLKNKLVQMTDRQQKAGVTKAMTPLFGEENAKAFSGLPENQLPQLLKTLMSSGSDGGGEQNPFMQSLLQNMQQPTNSGGPETDQFQQMMQQAGSKQQGLPSQEGPYGAYAAQMRGEPIEGPTKETPSSKSGQRALSGAVVKISNKIKKLRTSGRDVPSNIRKDLHALGLPKEDIEAIIANDLTPRLTDYFLNKTKKRDGSFDPKKARLLAKKYGFKA